MCVSKNTVLVKSFPYVPKELELRVFPYTAAQAPSFMFGQSNQYCAAASQRRPSAAAAGTVSNQNISSRWSFACNGDPTARSFEQFPLQTS